MQPAVDNTILNNINRHAIFLCGTPLVSQNIQIMSYTKNTMLFHKLSNCSFPGGVRPWSCVYYGTIHFRQFEHNMPLILDGVSWGGIFKAAMTNEFCLKDATKPNFSIMITSDNDQLMAILSIYRSNWILSQLQNLHTNMTNRQCTWRNRLVITLLGICS